MARLPKSQPNQARARARFSEEYGILIEMLVKLRLSARITQQQMADIIGKSQSHISMWENRESEMSIVDIMKWCDAVGIKTSKLFEAYENKFRHNT